MSKRFYLLRMLLFLTAALYAGEKPARDLSAATTELFSRQWNIPAGELDISFRKQPPELKTVKYDALKVTSSKRRLNTGVQTVWLELYWQEQRVRRLPLTVDVSVKRKVAVAGRKIKRGEVVTPADIRYVMKKIGRDWRQYVSTDDPLTNVEAKQSIAEGKVLTKRLLRPIPLIHRGDAVKVEITAGKLSLVTDGRAIQDGVQGKKIKVKLSTGKTVQARVVKSGWLVVR